MKRFILMCMAAYCLFGSVMCSHYYSQSHGYGCGKVRHGSTEIDDAGVRP